MLFLPEKLYEAAFPKAKAVCQRPHVVFDGTLEIDGERVKIDSWIGSENHNWGSKHTDTYAWGQVVGFDNAPDAFLECATARLKFGPLWTPPLTIAVMRVDGRDYKVNALLRSFRAAGRWGWKDGAFNWRFATAGRAEEEEIGALFDPAVAKSSTSGDLIAGNVPPVGLRPPSVTPPAAFSS